uniref:Ring finger protein 17 n=1 Tax=Labrus bergylta TaxID=56723 RepID=A0A3Q3FIY2_9LABR
MLNLLELNGTNHLTFQVESNLPEGGVNAMPEDSRIIGLIYTAKMNKLKRLLKMCNLIIQPVDVVKTERAVDEALAQGAENHALLENIHETLKTGLEEQVKSDRARLEIEIKQAADKAIHAVQKWKDVQLNQLSKLEARFSNSQAELCCVQERIRSLGIAMQMAREVRRVPFLVKYCTLDKVGNSFIQSTMHSQNLFNRILYVNPISVELCVKSVLQTPRKSSLQHAETGNSNNISPRHNKPLRPQKQDQGSPRAKCSLPLAFSSSQRPRQRVNLSNRSSPSDLRSPDVIVEEIIDEGKGNEISLLNAFYLCAAHPPTGPELANDKWRIQNRRKNLNQITGNKRNVTQWVVVSHILNPSHFYVRYVAEKRESELLSRRINHFCSRESCRFTSRDRVETGSLIFVKQREGLWCRASVVALTQSGCAESVKVCPVSQLASIRVFFIDGGQTRSFTIQSEEGSSESSLKAVNNHLRKVCEFGQAELGQFAPQAIRCSFKDLVPYDLSKGWTEKAQVEFRSVVGSAAVEMRPLSLDRDSLLVDLRKAPMDQSSDVPISIREYLVFIEVARFYSPVSLGRKPLSYYPPVYPKVNKEVNAVVSHINSPADFYIQLADNMEFFLLSAKLQECYNASTVSEEDDLKVYCPVIEQAYVARFEDKRWYRAQVVGLPGGRKVEVRYVDFGNKTILSVSDLRKIKDEFFALPSMAIQCCLSDVRPVDGESWTEACTDRFISLAHQKLVTIVATGRPVLKSKPLPVKLFESSLNGPLANIAELLVQDELVCFKEEPAGDDSAIWDPPLELDAAPEGPVEFEPQLKLPADLKDLKVRVSHVSSPSSFYVQLTQYDSQLKRMCELVRKECALMESDDDAVWKADVYCAAQINGVWERGQICSDITSSKIAEVLRCDHGNKVKVHASNLRTLPSYLIGSLALECTLTDIRPAGGRSTWTATACDLISYYLTGASAVMTIKELTDERPQPVILFCSNRMGQFVSIADFLASEGLALRERKPRDAEDQKPQEADAPSPVSVKQTGGPDGDKKNTPSACSLLPIPDQSSLVSGPTHPKPAPRIIMSAEKVKTQLYQPPELPCLGHIQTSVSAIGEDGIIYARTQNAECQLEPLRERIQKSMKTLPRQKPYTWKSVLGCAVIGSDMLWYRGQLLEVLGGHVKVQYVDYGLVENIPVVHVYPMLLCDDVPQLCMPCQLHSINPVGSRWHLDAVALLKELLLNRCVDVQVMELPSDPRGPLAVEIFLDGMSLSQIMCHHEHASMERPCVSLQGRGMIIPPPLLDDWDIDTEGLRDPEEPMLGPFMYPQLPQEGEHFKVRVMHLSGVDKMDQYCSPCLAEYSDGQYYRAKLIRITSVEPVKILVQHVDFGSDDTLPLSRYELLSQQEYSDTRLRLSYFYIHLPKPSILESPSSLS